MTKEEFITERTRIISEMLDNPDKYGIYPTTKCFEQFDNLFDRITSKSELAKEPEFDGITIEKSMDGKHWTLDVEETRRINKQEPEGVTADEIYKSILIKKGIITVNADDSWKYCDDYEAVIEAMESYARTKEIKKPDNFDSLMTHDKETVAGWYFDLLMGNGAKEQILKYKIWENIFGNEYDTIEAMIDGYFEYLTQKDK